jgi:hypothetical protein
VIVTGACATADAEAAGPLDAGGWLDVPVPLLADGLAVGLHAAKIAMRPTSGARPCNQRDCLLDIPFSPLVRLE